MTMTTKTSKTLRARNLGTAAVLAAVAACSYDAAKSDLSIHVTGLPITASNPAVVVTPSKGAPAQKSCPLFGVQNGSRDLAIAAPSAGTYAVTVQVSAFDADQNFVAT